MRRKIAPADLDAEAKQVWRHMLGELEKAKRTVTTADLTLLEGFARSYSRWKLAEAELAKTGPVVRSPQGGAMQSPWLGISRASLRDLRACLDQLGLASQSRRRSTFYLTPPPAKLAQFTRNRTMQALPPPRDE